MNDSRRDPPDGETTDERRRVGRVYQGYGANPRKQRSWSTENRGNAAIREELVDTVFALAGPALLTAGEILDIGCGSGWWLERLAQDERLSARLHGLELLADRARAAQNRVPTTAIVLDDARSLPYPDGSFDVVTMFTVLSSLSGRWDITRAVSEARRVLRSSGALVIWEPRLPNRVNRDTRFVSRSTLTKALAGMELRTQTTTLLPPLARRLGTHTSRLYPALARVPLLRTHVLVKATQPRT